MRFDLFSRRRWVAACVCILSVVATTRRASAQAIDNLSLNFEKIRFSYEDTSGAQVPFGVDLAVNRGEGNAVARLAKLPAFHKATDVTLKRGVIGQSDGEMHTTIEADVEQRSDDAFKKLGKLNIDVPSSGGAFDPVFRGSVRVAVGEIGDDDSSLIAVAASGIAETLRRDGLIVKIAAAPGQRLMGSPPELFNQPEPGEPLIGTLPLPAVGEAFEVELEVSDAETPRQGSGTLIPVKIKHNL